MSDRFAPHRLLACVLSLLAFAFAQAAEHEPFMLTILHANDTHSFVAGVASNGAAADDDAASTGGFARMAAAVAAEKAARRSVIALDAGDRWQGTLFFSKLGPGYITRLTNLMPWDAVTLGNHEFDRGCRTLARELAAHRAPVLAANLAAGACPLAERTVPWMIKDFDGVKVGIFGLASDEARIISKACPSTVFLPREEAARQAVKALRREGARIVIAVTHIGYPADRSLARSVEGIDVIVGGHTHSPLGRGIPGAEGPYPTVESSPSGDPVLVVQAKRSTEYLGRLTAAFDSEGRPAAWSGGLIRLSHDMPRAPELSSALDDARAVLADARSRYVATNANRLPDGLDPCRWGDCLAGMATADALRAFARPYGATVALVNGGAIRSSLPVGRIDRGSLEEIHPFANSIAVIDVSGEALARALENGLADPDVGGPHLLQPSGLRYAVDPKAPVGRRLLSADVEENGRWAPLDPRKTYRIATMRYLADGGDDFAMFAQAPRIPVEDALEVDVLEAYLRAHDPLPLPETGRITGMPLMP